MKAKKYIYAHLKNVSESRKLYYSHRLKYSHFRSYSRYVKTFFIYRNPRNCLRDNIYLSFKEAVIKTFFIFRNSRKCLRGNICSSFNEAFIKIFFFFQNSRNCLTGNTCSNFKEAFVTSKDLSWAFIFGNVTEYIYSLISRLCPLCSPFFTKRILNPQNSKFDLIWHCILKQHGPLPGIFFHIDANKANTIMLLYYLMVYRIWDIQKQLF